MASKAPRCKLVGALGAAWTLTFGLVSRGLSVFTPAPALSAPCGTWSAGLLETSNPEYSHGRYQSALPM